MSGLIINPNEPTQNNPQQNDPRIDQVLQYLVSELDAMGQHLASTTMQLAAITSLLTTNNVITEEDLKTKYAQLQEDVMEQFQKLQNQTESTETAVEEALDGINF